MFQVLSCRMKYTYTHTVFIHLLKLHNDCDIAYIITIMVIIVEHVFPNMTSRGLLMMGWRTAVAAAPLSWAQCHFESLHTHWNVYQAMGAGCTVATRDRAGVAGYMASSTIPVPISPIRLTDQPGPMCCWLRQSDTHFICHLQAYHESVLI